MNRKVFWVMFALFQLPTIIFTSSGWLVGFGLVWVIPAWIISVLIYLLWVKMFKIPINNTKLDFWLSLAIVATFFIGGVVLLMIYH